MRLTLASKISIAVFGVLLLALVSNIVAISSAYRFEAIQTTLVADNLESLRAAEELEISLLQQRGYAASYILDEGNEAWLDQLNQHRADFGHWLGRARDAARSSEEREVLDRLEEVQGASTRKRDEVVKLYDAGQKDVATQMLLHDVVALNQQAYDLCEDYIAMNNRLVDGASARVRRQVEQSTAVAIVTFAVTVVLGVGLLWLFFQGVIFPLKQMAAEVRTVAGKEEGEAGGAGSDELWELRHYVKHLMTDVTETRSDLEQSRTQLAHSDKLAAVGKLAACVAHEIRNPLTSVKLWLYSLRRNLGQDDQTQQKFDMVSEEIARLESIVRNFLEFAKPPSLKLQPQSVSLLLDKATELVQQSLESQRIRLVRRDERELPQAMVDAEQLKQVFLNLINNAIDAMPRGGEVHLSSTSAHRGGREMVAVRLADSGDGMTADVQQRVFEPFFTTKENGTGLGLNVAASIMARHNGLLELESSGPQGTQWVIWIPAADSKRMLASSESRIRPALSP
jgi:signal transduction histidine kinase